MKRLLLLGVIVGTPHAALALVIAAFILACAGLVVLTRVLFCKDEAPALRLRRLIRVIHSSSDR